MLLSSLIQTVGSQQKAQEILLLLHNQKPLLRQGYYESELPPIQAFCSQHSLSLVKSTFKVLLDDPYHFTNKGIRIPSTDPRSGMYFIYIAKDERTSYLASYYELTNNHHDLGLLLGYPLCCIDFFSNHFNEQHTNLEHAPSNPWTNLTQREKDICLLSHFPCSSECQESINLAQKYYAALEQVDPTYAKEIIANLNV